MPVLRQISVFLENVPGRLATLCNTLEVHGVDLRAMTTSEGSDYGVVRLIADDVDGAENALRDANLPFSTIDVLGIGGYIALAGALVLLVSPRGRVTGG